MIMLCRLQLPEPQFSFDDDPSGPLGEDYTEGPHELKDGGHGEDTEPEPQEDVNLFIDDIDRKHALSVVGSHQKCERSQC